MESEDIAFEAGHLATLPPSLAAAVADACAAVSHNLNGQKLGRKGRVTRERIVAAAIELVNANDEEITLRAVAQRAGLGLTSLYNYFTDLTELLLAVLDSVMATAESEYLAVLGNRWPDDRLYDNCYAFIHSYHGFWLRHSRLLHMRNALADQHDVRMMKHRIASSTPIISLLVKQMDEDASLGTPATSMATMLMIGIERSVTLVTDDELRELVGITPDISDDRYLKPGARLMEIAIAETRRRG